MGQTSEENDKKLREQGLKRDDNDPQGQYYGSGEAGGVKKVWEKDGLIRTEDDSTYRPID